MKKKYWRLLLCLPLLLTLTGCPFPWVGNGLVDYEIVYPSGHVQSRDTYHYPGDKAAPVEGTDWQLAWERAEDWEKSKSYDLQVLDGEGELLYTYPGLGDAQMRGEDAGAGAVWLCTEDWNAGPPYSCGYTSGDLEGSDLLLVDMADGTVLFQKELGANELFLTCREGKCYFYYCGSEAEERFFGLVKIPAKNSCVYYRDTEDWDDPVLVHDFGYVEWLEDEWDEKLTGRFRLRFTLDEDAVTVTAVARERPDFATQHWEDVEKASVTIPLKELYAV
ncbi:MAG: hypothetical protein HDT38_05525 [Clostridiales bacterium]|nr:hypothetical protein [Clostridiales bacterium]